MQGKTVKLILFLIGGLVVVFGGAYVTGLTDGLFPPRETPIAAAPQTPAQPATGDRLAAPQPPAAAPGAAAPVPPAGPPATPPPAPGTPPPAAGEVPPPAAAPAQPAPEQASKSVPPSFDVVRLEADGSLIVAGKATPLASVDVLTGSRILGNDKATEAGEFVAVLNDRLAPGDYTIVLRATAPDGAVLTSLQSAIVSVPSRPDGEVLVMVEQPGEPAKILTAPQPEAAAAAAAPAQPGAAPAQPGGESAAAAPTPPAAPAAPAAAPTPSPAPGAVAAAGEGAAQPSAPPPGPPSRPTVTIEAVEIEGPMVFVAGMAEAKREVRVYANEMLLGQSTVSDGGRFLVEARRDLPVGSYVIRADVLGPDGTTVIARAAVPFEREPGEQIAAVAPPAPPQPAPGTPAQPGAPAAPSAPSQSGAVPPTPGGQPAGAAPSAPPAGDGTPGAAAQTPATPSQPAMPGQAASAPETTAPKLQATAGSVIIRRGDSLWRISRRVYGMGVRYSTIYLANQDQIEDPNRIWPGQVFALPSETDKGEPADLSRIPGQVQQN